MEKLLDKQDVITMLREHGITPTQQRIEIARLLFSKPQHLSIEQMLDLQRSEGSGYVSKATVYNTMNLFARKGLVREINVDSARVFYDSNTSEHHHIFNLDTGELSDVSSDDVKISGIPSLPEGTISAGIEVIFRVRSDDTPHHSSDY